MRSLPEKEFQYSRYARIGGIIVSVMTIGLAGIFVIIIIDILIEALSGDHNFTYIANMFINLLVVLALPVIWMNWYQGFKISNEGMTFKVFTFWEKFVPWGDILRLKKSWMFWGKYHILILEHLTPFHRILGLLYGLTLRPGFVILRELPESEEAVRLIERRLSGRPTR